MIKHAPKLKDGTLIVVFTRDIEGNPFEKGFSLKLPS